MLHRRPLVVQLAMLTLAALAIACGSGDPGSPTKPTAEVGTRTEPQPLAKPVELVGTEWVLTSLNGRDPEEGPIITLAFPNTGELSGNAGCNYYGARYTSDGNGFSLSEGRIDTTDFACDVPDSVMQQEAAYFEALRIAAVYGIIDDRLVFVNAAGETILAFTMQQEPSIDPALEDTEWVLTSLNGRSLLEGHVHLCKRESLRKAARLRDYLVGIDHCRGRVDFRAQDVTHKGCQANFSQAARQVVGPLMAGS